MRVPVLALVVAALALPVFAGDPPAPLAKEKEIALAGGPGWDLMAVDSDAGLLYVAHSPHVDVVDVAKSEQLATVDGVERAHGVVVVPAIRRGFAAAGGANRLVVFDLATRKPTQQVPTGENPDAVVYVSATNEVWCFNGKSRNVTCVDATSLEVKATVALDGKPELAVEDAGRGLVYTNLEDASAICVLDSRARKVLATHPVAPGVSPTGIALDGEHGLVLVGCGNQKLVALSTKDWSVVGTADIGEHCDGVAFDAGTGCVFASCRGQSAVVRVKGGTSLETLAPLETPGGKTCALDPKTHRLFVSSGPKRGDPGTVKVLVFAPGSGAAPAQASSWTGRVEKLGVTTTMQGTHRLVLADGKSVLLVSAGPDLAPLEGKTVTVFGRASAAVEGGATIVTVQSVKEAP